MAIKGLDYVIHLTDKMTGPLKGVSKGVDNFVSKTKSAMSNIAMGGAGLFAVGKSMQAALMPAIEMDRALGEVASLGVADSAIEKLRNTATEFAVEYGKDSVEVVKSAYGIKQAFGELSDLELSGLTKTTNVMAAAIKTDANSAKDYLSRLYSIYKNEADSVGKVQWAEKVASQTAIATTLFKSSVTDIEAGFKTVSGTAQKMGVSLGEQMAVIGQLGDKVDTTKAGKQFESFLLGLDSAEKKLGMSFHDNNGKLLSTDKILRKLKAKFGDVTKHRDILKKAFGGDGAYKFIANMIDESDRLGSNIDKLANVKGMDAVSAQAHKMTDVWEQLEALTKGIAISIGSSLQPVLYPILSKIVGIGKGFLEWLNTYRNIARWIGYLFSALMGFAAVGPVIMTLKGIFGLWWGSMKGAWTVMTKLAQAKKLNIALNKLWAATMWVVNTVMKVISIGARLMWAAVTAPIGLVIAAIALIGYAIYANWDKIKAACLAGWEWLTAQWNAFTQWLSELWGSFSGVLAELWDGISAVFTDLWAGIQNGWDQVVAFFSNISPLESFKKLGQGLTDIFTNAYNNLKNSLIGMVNWLIEKLNKLPGVNIDLIPTVSTESTNNSLTSAEKMASLSHSLNAANLAANAGNTAVLPSLPDAVKPKTEFKQGFLANKNISNQTSHTVNYGGVNVYANDPKAFEKQMQDRTALGAA
ncbi:phage tail tape measure protein [Avibacterium paragallinarum]|uniref:Phage tail tape measure protein n=3 Tax=Avibacterium paragallinarum TaxID=728 RepID=A0ABU7QJ18_AVIPA|nr:phage tail tape measure protein [Avibacterium paragallinarum]WAL56551.1 phage tail tape measure protein [Avibacterium paragallinarum]WAM59216.1 phage tail tape measure protein [Avibacterium paragallinarum]